MPKVRLLVDAPGSPDGVNVINYKKGREYDVPADLANALVEHGVAEEVKAEKPKPAANKKASAPAENK